MKKVKDFQGQFLRARIAYKILASIMLLTFTACTNQVSNATPNLNPSPTETPSATVEVQTKDDQTLLDLHEANVISVSIKNLGNGTYRFNVKLQHDDEGESPNFADYWQVEDLNGQVLGKRILAHSHSNVPFTRTETISIPEGVTQVVVRGHDMNHGFGGQAMSINLLSGETMVLTDSLP